MTKTFNFKTKKNNNNSIFFNSYNNSSNITDYSAIIDNIIADSIIKKNSYLFDCDKKNDADIFTSLIGDTPIILNSSTTLKADDDFIKAAMFLANYKTYKKTYNIPFILGKMYKLSDGTPIIFYDDEIQIGFDTYKYSNFSNLSFLNNLATTTKKTIINIYTGGLGNIKINIL